MRRRLRKLKKFLRAHWPVVVAVTIVALVLMTQLRSNPTPPAPALVFKRATATPTATPPPSPTASEGTARPTPRLVIRTPKPTVDMIMSAQQAILTQVNAARASAGVDALTSNPTLQRIAQAYADEMASGQFLSHTSLRGTTFQDRMLQGGYRGSSTAENLGVTTQLGGADIVGMWMDSSGHRTNMLNPVFRAVGIGIATGLWEGMSATYVVAEFGSAR
jgi:uncharacterized protein YkwD